ncbi:YybH family protein [Roseimaritima sediminicola]|uniref:YybH family protein n=1 Tax=Roseimaritima sediminicola TaxID=2662066 RepID=UPI00129839E3|nr:SgcJ/EcaC family oxidoreductase [Roseimaritima sediminicola]
MKSAITSLAIVAWGTLSMSAVRADEAGDEAAIREAVETYVAAYNQHDAAAVAALWSPEAVYLDPLSGNEVAGREAIEKRFSDLFAADKGVQLAATTESVQFVSPNVAVEKGTAVLKRPESTPEETQYSAVYIKRDGKWLLDRVSENEPPAIAPSNAEHLAPLEWMIGSWVDSDDQATVRTRCQWTKNRNFILRLFSIAVDDQIEFAGMQIIGWDPGQQRIRSWVFDSEGGFGQGVWRKQDNAWYIETTGTAPDGSAASSVNIIDPVDDNTFTWQSIDRVADGQLLPNVDEVVVRRQDTQP